MAEVRERYDNLDGLRTISCLCIIAMHINANANYTLHPVLNTIIASWTHFVPLFLMISGFGMFCGYYEGFKNGSINLNIFFTKRYKKIVPFFITLILIDIVMDRSLTHVIEGITEATLVFGLLPNNQPEVIGVSWTLGVIFLFYMLFPFFVYLCWNKKRVWITYIFSLILSICCTNYYFTEKFVIESFAARHCFLFCAPYFLGGGIIYIYRKEIRSFIKRFSLLWLCGCVALTVAWYYIPSESETVLLLKNIVLFTPWLTYAISVNSKILNNKTMKYLSGISLELYLAQMVVFRVAEKTHILYLLGHGWIGHLFAFAVIVIGLIAFVEIWRIVWSFIQTKIRPFSKRSGVI